MAVRMHKCPTHQISTSINQRRDHHFHGFNACTGSGRENSGNSRHGPSSNPRQIAIDGNTYTKHFGTTIRMDTLLE